MSRLVNIYGLILPGEFDDNGRCISIHLCTADERHYPLVDKTAQRSLMMFLRQNAHVHGRMMIEAGRPVISVLTIIPAES